MNIKENESTYILKEENILKIKNLINLILSAKENTEYMYKLAEQEKNEIELISILLEILSDFNNYIINLTPEQNLYILIYIKNILPKYKAKPKMKSVEYLEDKILKAIKFYLNFNFCVTDNETFENIKKMFDVIIPYLFEFIVVMEQPRNFLTNIYNNIFLSFLNNSDNNNDDKFLIKFIFSFENFCRIYLIYIYKNEEMNIIFEKYYRILKICYNNSNINSKEKKGNLINQCIISFSKTTLLSLEHFIKTKIFHTSPNLSNNEQNEKRFNFLDNKYIFKFINYCFYLDGNKNNFSFGLEYANQNDKIFEFLLCKGKGVLIELLYVIIKKLSRFELFKEFTKFNSKVLEYFCNIIEYLIEYYQKGNYPREKAENNSKEIIQLGTIVKLLNFIEEIIGNNIYHDLLETNNFIINSNNKYEKYSNIFKYIIVPNLLKTDLEQAYFDFHKDDYLQNLIDMSQSCDIKLPKQKSIKLLMSMCENIDEFLSYIVHVYIYILKNISLNTEKKENSNIKIEQKYENLYFFLTKNIDLSNLFEQALQVLSSLYHLYWDKDYLSDFFCDEIDIINYMLIKINDPFLKSKLCIFYSISLEILFHNDDEVLSKSFDDSLGFLFENIFCNIPSLQKTSFYCLNQIIFNKYSKKFCVTSVRIHTLKIINYFNDKENLEGFEEEFNFFLKGIVKEYLFDLDDSTIQIFDLFWNKFYINLEKNINNENNINKIGILKDKTKEVNESTDISNQINIINNFIKMITNKNMEIKNKIYEKIMNLFPNLKSYINTDYEEEILELITKIILDIKLIPDSYFKYFIDYINIFNQGNNNYEYRIENYHLDFIFNCLKSFKMNLTLNGNVKEILIKILNTRLLTSKRGIPLNKIITEHCLYCNLGFCINIHFFGDLNKSNIIDLISLFYQRMEKMPNTNFELNVKLCINIFLLLIKIDDYEIYDEIFLINKKVNLYTFINKVISFFPVKKLSLIEQQIVSIFCSTIIRYLILKQKNNQDVLLCDKVDLNFINNNYTKIFFYLFNINLTQLDIIKNKSTSISNRIDKNEELLLFKKRQNLIVIDSYEINDKNGKKHFKKNKDMEYSEREPHDKSIININKYKLEDNNDENNSYDFFNNDDEFLIIDEYNKKLNEEEEYNDENINPIDEENYEEDNEEDDDDDDRDQYFLTIKNNNKNSYLKYYNKYANEKLIVNLKQINEFKLFEIMMKDIELNDKNTLNEIFDKINKTYGENKLKLIEKYRGIQKISFQNKSIISYRRIVKIKRK